MTDAPREPGAQPTERMLETLYTELRDLAHSRMRHERGRTLRTTELVHEAYLRLRGDDSPTWENRAHFFAAAAEAMRRILIERARARGRRKRGGDDEGRPAQRISLSDVPALDLAVEWDPSELLALEDAITNLERNDPRAGRVVRLRFYSGLSLEETAEALGVAVRTVKRDWTFARAWLLDRLGAPGS
ncbi:MAG: ECF-type sigma factor [bacterium]